MSESLILLDAGPLVALIDRRDQFHQWASEVVADLPTPFLTSECILSESAYILQRGGVSVSHMFDLIERRSLVVALDFQAEWRAIAALVEKYADQPMSLADASLVRLAELHDLAAVFTVDSDFRIYRKHGRRQIPLIFPDH